MEELGLLEPLCKPAMSQDSTQPRDESNCEASISDDCHKIGRHTRFVAVRISRLELGGKI